MSGALVFVSELNEGLLILDVSDPAAPAMAGYLDTGGLAYAVAVSGDVAFVADGSAGLRLFDVSPPASTHEIGSLATPGEARDVTVIGSFAYVADEAGGLRVVDVADPTAPVEVGYYDTAGQARGVAAAGPYAFVADGADGLWIFSNHHLLTDVGAATPMATRLLQAYPNPCNPRATIAFELAQTGSVRLTIHDVRGRRVSQLAAGTFAAGRHTVSWEGRDANGRALPSGTYLVQLETGLASETRRLMLVR